MAVSRKSSVAPLSLSLAVPLIPPIDCAGTLTSVGLVRVPVTVSGFDAFAWMVMLTSRSPDPALMIMLSATVDLTSQP